MRPLCRVALLAGAAFVVACAPATSVRVTIDAEPGVRGAAERLTLVVRGSRSPGAPFGTRVLDQTVRPGVDDPAYPFDVVLAPLSNESTRIFEITATAEQDDGTFVAQARIIGGYLSGRERVLHLLLEDSCRDVVCDDSETCTQGRCVDARDELLGADAGPSVADSGMVDAAGTDAGARDTGPVGPSFIPRNMPSDVWERATGSINITTAATIDTTSGAVLVDGVASRGFAPLDVEAAGGCAAIFVMVTGSFVVGPGATVTVSGGRSLAIVSTGQITIDGTVDVGARGARGGPGSVVRRAGGGYGTEGGLGGCDPPGGIIPTYGNAELTGLCGGSSIDSGGGGGGGAIELASAVGIDIRESATVRAVGGGGAWSTGVWPIPNGHGGSGGAVLLQAPDVRVAGVVSVNGGGGAGGFGSAGADGTLTSSPASGGPEAYRMLACTGGATSGAGGRGAAPSGGATAGRPGVQCSVTGCTEGGAGGGGAGRIRVDGFTTDFVSGSLLEYPSLPGVFSSGTL